MLLALGMEAWNREGNKLNGFGSDVHYIHKISFNNLDPRIQDIELKVACDVDNPLCGNRGASKVFGPQKGASKSQIVRYDEALSHYGSLIETKFGKRLKDIPGAGAAGGVGFALLAIEAELVSGANLLANAMQLEEEMKQADFVITGEG